MEMANCGALVQRESYKIIILKQYKDNNFLKLKINQNRYKSTTYLLQSPGFHRRPEPSLIYY